MFCADCCYHSGRRAGQVGYNSAPQGVLKNQNGTKAVRPRWTRGQCRLILLPAAEVPAVESERAAHIQQQQEQRRFISPQSVPAPSICHQTFSFTHTQTHTHARKLPTYICSKCPVFLGFALFCRWTEYYSITNLLLLTFPPVTSAVWHLWLLLKCLGDHGMDCRDIWWRHLCYRRRWIILTVLVA